MNSLQHCVCRRGCVIQPQHAKEIQGSRALISAVWAAGSAGLFRVTAGRKLLADAVFRLHDCALFQWLLKHDFELSDFETPNSHAGSILIQAITELNLCTIETIIEKEPNIARNNLGYLRCAFTTDKASVAIVRCLLRNGGLESTEARESSVLEHTWPLGDPERKAAFIETLDAGADLPDAASSWVIPQHQFTELTRYVFFFIACGAKMTKKKYTPALDRNYQFKPWEKRLNLLPDCYEKFRAALLLSGSIPEFHGIDKTVLNDAKKAVAREQIGLVKRHAIDICFGLQALDLPAFVTLQIIDRSWNFVADLVPMHLKWKLVTLVKHFHKPKDEENDDDEYYEVN